MFVAAAVLTSIQVALGYCWFTLARHGGETRRRLAVGAGILNGLFALCSGPLLLGQFLILFVCACIVLAARGRPRTYLFWSVLLTVLLFGFAGSLNRPQWIAVKERFPLESIADRLAYETRHGPAQASNSTAVRSVPESAQLDVQAMTVRLDRMEEEIYRSSTGRNRRAVALRMAHASQVEQFVNSPGFGVGRAIIPSPRYLELAKEVPPIRMPDTEVLPPYDDSHSDLAARAAAAPCGPTTPSAPLSPQLTDKLHLDALVDFVNADGFGYIRDREHVAGFIAHRFSALPEIPERSSGTERWLTRRVELVSLLKHVEPMVYVSQNLPSMDELRDARVRPLDAFEKRSLNRMRAGEDVIIESGGHRIRMLGSLRATKQCLECHSVDRGELLGAFSYELVLDPPPPIDGRSKRSDDGVL